MTDKEPSNMDKLFLHVQKQFLTHVSENQIEKDDVNKIFQRILLNRRNCSSSW